MTPIERYILAWLAMGLIAGLAAGPLVLGRWAPEWHASWIAGGSDEWAAIDEFDKQAEEDRARLVDTDVSEVALVNFDLVLSEERQPLLDALSDAQREHRRWIQGVMQALVAVLVTLLLAEAAPAMRDVKARRDRLTLARSVVLAAWLAMLVAHPRQLLAMPWLVLLVTALPLIAWSSVARAASVAIDDG